MALRLYQLTRPGFLTGVNEYDDGVYFGSAVRLVHGVIPYRDFVMVQPPGISLLMTPVALLSRLTGTGTGFALARVLTACAGAAGVTLAGLLVRRKGIVAMTLACGVLAVYPAGINAAHTVLLEPWLVLFCLAGALAMFEGDHVTTHPGRLAWGGVAFGAAGAIKLWAVFPVVVLLVVCRRNGSRRPRRPYLAGVIAGFGIPVIPFLLLAPQSFYHGVVVAQLSRVDLTRVSVWDRLQSLTGLSAFAPVAHGTVLLTALAMAGFAIVGLLRSALRTRQAPTPLEWFAVGTAALLLAAFIWPPDYYEHYAWFFAPFLALCLALAAGRLTAALSGRIRLNLLAPSLSGLVALALLWTAVVEVRQEARLTATEPAASAQRQIPAGACVLTDITSLTIVADRFVSSEAGCSMMVDTIGTDYALSPGRNGVTGAGRSPAVQAVWLSAFRHARYVWLACPPTDGPACKTNRRIPWTGAISGYFASHFRLVRKPGAPAYLYVRRRA